MKICECDYKDSLIEELRLEIAELTDKVKNLETRLSNANWEIELQRQLRLEDDPDRY